MLTASPPSPPSASAGALPVVLAEDPQTHAGETWRDHGRTLLGTCQVVVPMICLTIYLLSLTDVQPVSDWGRALACANFWICAVPLWMFLVGRRRTIPFAAFALPLYAIYFSFPVFASTPLFFQFPTLAWEGVDRALALALAGSLSMLAGLFGTGFLLAPIRKFKREIDLKRALPALTVVSIVALGVRLLVQHGNVGPFHSLLYSLSMFGEITSGALIVAWLRGYLNIGYKASTVVLVASIPMIGLGLGFLAAAFVPVAGWLFLYIWERRRIPWIFILVGFLFFIPFNAAKHAFRANTWGSGAPEPGPAGFVIRTWDFAMLAYEHMDAPDTATDNATTANESRMNALGMLALVATETPRAIPYWDGYTYSDLFWKFIPRVFVPSKPSPAIGQEFPRRYGLIDYYNYETSYNLPQLVEAYINFGPIGVVVVMFIIGFIYAALNHVCSNTLAGALIGCTLFAPLLVMESNFTLVFGGLLFPFPLFSLLIRLFPNEESAGATSLNTR